MAIGQGVIRRPVSTAVKCRLDCSRNGSDTSASICAANEQIEVPMESAKIGIRIRSTGSIGAAVMCSRAAP